MNTGEHDADELMLESGDSADLDAGMDAAEEAERAESERTDAVGAADGSEPMEEGPRRRLLVVLAAVVGAILLWMLFRSVPAEQTTEDARAPAPSKSVEEMANQSDPSWMSADSGGGIAGAPGVVPPVFGPPGQGVPNQGVAGDTAAGAATPPAGPAGDSLQQPQAADPRRESFLAALRSKPLQGNAAFTGDGRADGSEADLLPDPPSLAEMDAAAQAEAERRAVSATGGFSVPSAAETGAPVSARSAPVAQPRAPAPMQVQPTRWAAEVARLTLPAGTVIEGQLHTAVVSDRPGVVRGMVTRTVYDASQRFVVIPQYSWLTGTYDSDVAAGDARLVVQWTSVRFPSGESYALPELRAGDRTGASGLRASVNNHYGTVFGQAVLSSVIAAVFTGAADDGSSATRARGEVIAGAAAEQLGRTAAEVTRRNLSIKPTLRVPRLTRFSIILDRDLTFTRPARE